MVTSALHDQDLVCMAALHLRSIIANIREYKREVIVTLMRVLYTKIVAHRESINVSLYSSRKMSSLCGFVHETKCLARSC